jgi:hypothetical protein
MQFHAISAISLNLAIGIKRRQLNILDVIFYLDGAERHDVLL